MDSSYLPLFNKWHTSVCSAMRLHDAVGIEDTEGLWKYSVSIVDAQLVQCFPCKPEDLSLDSKDPCKKAGCLSVHLESQN